RESRKAPPLSRAAAPLRLHPSQPIPFRALAGERAEVRAPPFDGRGPSSPAVMRDPECARRAPETPAYPKGGRAIMKRSGWNQGPGRERGTPWARACRVATLALVLVAGVGARVALTDDPPPPTTFTPISDDFKGDTLKSKWRGTILGDAQNQE